MKGRYFGPLVIVLVIAYAAGQAWLSQRDDPHKRAERALGEAQALFEANRPGAAADALFATALRDDAYGQAARDLLLAAMDEQALAGAPAQELVPLVQRVAMLQSSPMAMDFDVIARVREAAAAHGASAPLVYDTLLDLAGNLADADVFNALQTRRIALLQPAAADEAVAVRLGEVLYYGGDLAAARDILEPLRDRLDGDAARVLAMSDMARGDLAAARPLLTAFVEPAVARLHDYSRRHSARYDAVNEDAIDDLNADKGPRSFYDAYYAADESEQPLILDRYISGVVAVDPQIVELRYLYNANRYASSAALDLGQLLIYMAQETADRSERDALYAEAKDILLQVGEFAGEQDDYRLNLGKVHYWLGEHEAGQAQFDSLLEAHGRSVRALYEVGSVLRAIGINGRARELIGEAYDASDLDEERHAIATLLANLATDLEEERVWLNRADPDDPVVQASLASLDGQIALRDGDDAAAAAGFRKAIALYDAMEQSDTTANNSSIAYHRLYFATGDLDHFHESVRRMRLAAELSPQAPIVVQNAAATSLTAAATTVFSDFADLGKLRASASFGMLDYLYGDQAGRTRIVTRTLAEADAAEGLRLLRRAMVMRPGDARGYQVLSDIAIARGDDAGLEELERQLAAAELDHHDTAERWRRYLAGEDDAINGPALRQDVAKRRERTAQAQRDGGVDLALAATGLARALRDLSVLDDSVDAGEVVRAARIAHEAAPSLSTSRALVNALVFRAIERHAIADAAVRAQRDAQRRFASGYERLSAVIDGDGATAAALLADADVTAALAERKRLLLVFPGEAAGDDWLLFSRANDPFAQEVTGMLRNATVQRRHRIAAMLDPADREAANALIFLHEALGETDAAARLRAAR